MKKTLIMLVFALLVFAFVSCGTATENADTTTATEAEKEIVLNADYGGYEFNVLTSGCGGNYNDFDFEEEK